MPRIQQLLQSLIPNQPILHISFFDGIGTASQALKFLGANVIFTMSWETDPDCQAVLHHHHQPIQHGDITHLDRETLNLLIQPLVQENPDMIILITTGPPCVDFSRLRHQPPGTQGQQGNLLQRQSDIIINLQDDWPEYQILYLLENVIPHTDVEPQFQAISEQLRSRPYVVDAKDGGLISRPRVWWQNIQWETAAHIVHQFTPWQIIRTFQRNTWHLHNPIAALLQPTFHTKDWETPAVLQEGQPFHCLTTQAPTDQGRPPPKSSHVDTSTWQRWEEHGRQFAPWQYMPQYLTRHQDGPWQPITPLQRERLMGFPDHYTQPPHTHITDRSRNTMLGNSWHVPTAIWMLFLLLISAQSASIHPGVQYTNLQKMTTIWNNSAVPWGPPPQTPPHHYMPQMDWTRHLHWAQQHHQNSQQQDPLDPTLHWAIQQQARIPNINEVRANVATELQSLVSEWADTTDTWFRQLPDHCQRAYRQPKMITQIPLLHHLLQNIQYPHADILFRELTEGFPLIGNLQPGLNWKVRTDTKYTEHQSVPELHTYNRAYILKKLHQHRVDDHWQMMADEIAKEVQMGRMDGPFTAPTWWDVPAVALTCHQHTRQLKPLPHPTPVIAVAFSIHQTGSDGQPKVRRGEDWRRSGHNRSCNMADQPHHHTPDHYVWLAQHTSKQHPDRLHVWGHDHDGAYRQLPLQDPSLAYVLLLTPEGPTLWLHHVLLFGSAASVWSYNRFGDMLTSITRVLTATPVVHFVDDYSSIQPIPHADSGFQGFGLLNSTLGFHMKQSKEQPPQHEHKIQGVYIHLTETHVTVRPCPQRVHNIIQTIQQALASNHLEPNEAQKLAGKCSFTTSQLFGKVGRAANRALYDHSYSQQHQLSKTTRQGLIAMVNILQNSHPRRCPLQPTPFSPTIIYTDAFYTINGYNRRCSDLTEEDLQQANKDLPNGWGIVVFSAQQTPMVTSGHIPPNLLQQFASSQAFIYFLEAWAAIIAPVLFRPVLTTPYIQLCDNEASKHAILKGTGKHQPLNNLIGSHWTWHNRSQLHQVLDRVPSKANIADPFSRGDFSIATDRGWRILRPPHTEILRRTFKIIGDTSFAHEHGFDGLPGVSKFHDHILNP